MNNANFSVKLEVKFVSPSGEFDGYASVFNVVDKVNDNILKGAFEESLEKYREQQILPPLLWQHDSSEPIGEWLEMYEDEHGLFVKGKLFIGQLKTADEAYALLRKNIVTGLSIGYRAQDFYKDARGVRILTRVDLEEVSLVTFPANEYARVKTDEDESNIPTEREIEAVLRNSGLSRKQAKGIVSCGYKSLLGADDIKQDGDNIDDIIRNIRKITKELDKFVAVGK